MTKKPSIYNVFLFQSAVKYHFGRHDTAWILFGDASWRSDANDRSFSLLISLRVSLATVAMETPACCSNWCWWLINKQLSVEWCDVISSPMRCCCCRFSLLRWFWNHTFTYSFSDSFVLQSPARMWRCSSNPAGSSGFRGMEDNVTRIPWGCKIGHHGMGKNYEITASRRSLHLRQQFIAAILKLRIFFVTD